MKLTNWALLLVTAVVLIVFSEGLSRALLAFRTSPAMHFHPEVVYRYAPHSEVNGIALNDIGCIGDDVLSAKKTDELRVLLLGGSTSFSPQYVNSLRHNLSKELPKRKISVMSCGRPRYTSSINYENLRRNLISTTPDAVVLYMGINDNIYNSFPWSEEIPEVGFFNWRAKNQLVSLKLIKYHLFDKPFRSISDFKGPPFRSEAIFRRNIQAIVAFLEQAEVQPVLSTFAMGYPTEDAVLREKIMLNEPKMKHFWGSLSSTVSGVMAHNKIIREVSKSERLPLAEIAKSIPATSDYFVDLCHLTGTGADLQGEVISRSVLKGLKER